MDDGGSALFGVIIGGLVTWIISHREQRNAFRLAALERRLETHQRAYELWWKLSMMIYQKKETLNDYVGDCLEWWSKNCLYLDPETRKAFKGGLIRASFYKQFRDTMTKEDRAKYLADLQSVYEIISRGVELPDIGDKGPPLPNAGGDTAGNFI
jgi:hypothetical protein